MAPPYEFRGNNNNPNRDGRRIRPHNNNRQDGPRHEFTFRFGRPTSERPLLTRRRETTPELLTGGKKDGDALPSLKFASLDNLTDTDEAEMDVSDSGEGEEDGLERPARKKRIVEEETKPDLSATPPAPKWSNPDPYTVLPPPDETTGKKTDVVKLIRKARLAAAASADQDDMVKTNEDFISFDMDDDEIPSESLRPPENAPTGPRSDRIAADPSMGGSRKRTHDDEIKGYSRKKGKSMFEADGAILDRWAPRPEANNTPWLSLMVPTLHVGSRLHNEILSFYSWVKPQDFEEIVRRDLVDRLQTAFGARYYGARVHAFGSFASGMYLPVADMDLVLLSSTFARTRKKVYGLKSTFLYQFASYLKNLGITVPGSIETIAHARVPILKFVDKISGLRVDLSFDNDSGLKAINTFQVWKAAYPAMPVIVAVIKQFLLQRGLNEVPNGGLGGFSIICLVTSLLQHIPQGYVSPNLGSILMDFLDFYGRQFDYQSVGIRMEPPEYFNKRTYGKAGERSRLAIEDPNNKDNDISGGSREVPLIFRSFATAYNILRQSIVESVTTDGDDTCFLSTIIAGCYDEYIEQREHLRTIFETDPRFASYRTHLHPYDAPPPPSDPPPSELPPAPPSLPPPPPLPISSASSTTSSRSRPQAKTGPSKLQRRMQASKERAERLRNLRPDLIGSIPATISNGQAMSLGGYKSQSDMDRDLAGREKQLQLRQTAA